MKKLAFYQSCKEIKVMEGALKCKDPGFDIWMLSLKLLELLPEKSLQ